MKRILPLLLLAVVAGVAGFGAYQFFGHPIAGGASAAPDISLRTLDGSPARLADYRGKLVLVNFWATWCAPCLKEIPLLVKTQDQYAVRGLQILGPAMDDPEAVKAALPRLKIQYPVLIGESEIPPAMDALGDTLGALPFSVLINAQGEIVERKHGEFEPEELTRLVEENLPPG
ncbi:MAG: TlpA family protein disulfide reductase [Panacagrimonas sp.]